MYYRKDGKVGPGKDKRASQGRGSSQPRSATTSTKSAEPNESSQPNAPGKPGLFAPKADKRLYRAIQFNDIGAYEQIGREHRATHGILCSMLAGAGLVGYAPTRAKEHLQYVWRSGEEPAAHPFAKRYLRGHVNVAIGPGLRTDLALTRSTAGLLLAMLHAEQGDVDPALQIMTRIPKSPDATVLESSVLHKAQRWDDLVSVTEGTTNRDDFTAYLCALRGIAFRELGHYQAGREALREALKSRSRASEVRHFALFSRAVLNKADGKHAQARKDFERILAENSSYPGLREELDHFDT